MMVGDRYEWLIGLRYLRSKRTEGFISVITFLSMGGIALGVAALIVVLAVMTGFRAELERQILGVTSDIVIQPLGGMLTGYGELLQKIRSHPQVEAAAPFVVGQALLSADGGAAGAVFRGVDPAAEKDVSSLEGNLRWGNLADLPGFGIILGRRLADRLGVGRGDRVNVMVPVTDVTAMGSLPRMKRFRLVGIFESGMYDYDNTLAYAHLPDVQKLFRLGEGVTGIEVRCTTPDDALEVSRSFREGFGGVYDIKNWMDMNANFFKALQLEKATMFVILFLVVVVAAFNIISTLIMIVMEKGRDIAILKTMGATSRGIMAIFLINGGVIGIVGTLVGLGLGLILADNLEVTLKAIERLFHIQILSGEVYYIDHLPSRVLFSDVAWITGVSLGISLLATLYPARRAARVDPVETLRYE
ncbi:MAG: lipoprotein-releasing ABC transporter permease subunit [Magnetococcales bacterium]|nr:lipoprotein-releasing ABC transporter permease subunit [Magnetococcales bacterium]MBF0156636.1 lipoprotein-releasing ABC transporter permease subunit [Magnetococcales bacterium]